MMAMKKLKMTLDEFEDWLRDRGYNSMMGEDNLKLYLNIGLAGLFFSNSSLLFSYIFSHLGLPAERLADRIKFEVGKKVREIKADKFNLELVLDIA